MALNVKTGTFTDLTSTGNKTISLASNFDPKAIIMWGTKNTADGSIAHGDFCIGFGTYRGSAVVQNCSGIRLLDAAAAADTSRLMQTDALIKILTDAAASITVDLEIDLVSMQTGSTSEVVVNVANAAPAAWRMHYMILGGSDITDALVGTGAVPNASPEDVTVASGFGKPELLFLHASIDTSNWDLFEIRAEDPQLTIGFGKQGEAGRCMMFTQQDGNTASLTCQGIFNNKIGRSNANPGAGTEGTVYLDCNLDTTVSNWPTDGFRMIHNNVAFDPAPYCYLAIRTTGQITTGEDSGNVSGNQDDDVGYTPTGAFVLGMNASTANTGRVADAQQCAWMVGAYDGTSEVSAGISEDDAALTMDSNQQSSTTKLIQTRDQAGTIDGEADGIFTGTTFRRDWTDQAPAAYKHQWLVLGGSASAAYTLDCQPGSFVITGSAATLALSKFLDCQPGSYTLTGMDATLSRGVPIDAQPGSYSITGAAAGLSSVLQLDAQPGSYTITGIPATIGLEIFLNAEPGSFAITGVATGLATVAQINAAPGGFTVTGVAAATMRSTDLDAQPGSFTVTGAAATLPLVAQLDAQPGSYGITGAAAGLLNVAQLDAQPGVYVITGVDATLEYVPNVVGTAYSLDAQPGSFAITGAAATLAAAAALDAQPGSFAVTGAAAALLTAGTVNASPGAFTVTGAPAGLLGVFTFDAQPGAFTISGFDAQLQSAGMPQLPLEGDIVMVSATGEVRVIAAESQIIMVRLEGDTNEINAEGDIVVITPEGDIWRL